ncbi:3-ketoacyl-ACP reductase [Acuticoccus sediminis]|uniref:3-ketoacyl-ACP reductase n=1 Tax=Acuticoccus sediminis TaxID=2184697 RepID=A0A8B2NW00_9HYPH|nr:SDR family oxidoreductase [Acuticoccus sediminis]RAH99886.1 3-ketoacyl-ACP reductase [Acuticoccus sediminis]
MRRTALITGGSSGIGAAIARRFGYDGIRVLVHYRGGEQAAAGVVSDIEAAGGEAFAVEANVADSRAAPDLFDLAEARFGSVDILVNCAGILQEAPLAEVSDEMFEMVLAVNLYGSFHTMREAARRMKQGGRIVNVSSSELSLNMPGYSSYNATKGAVEAITRVLAKELGPKGITVNAVAVAPGSAECDSHVDRRGGILWRGSNDRAYRHCYPADDIVGLVKFLASEKAGWIHGQILRAHEAVT